MDSRTAHAPRLKTADGRPSAGALRGRAAAPVPRLRVVRRHGERDAENLLVHGDNLSALHALASTHAGRFRCVYLDPPFNTGRSFAEYKDSLTTADWTAMMRPRLEALRPLLTADGSVFAEIDDTELGRLLLLMDEVFGARNRISTVTVVRSASTGHKAQNRGPVNVSDFLLIYARDRKRWHHRPQVRVRDGIDPAYGTWLENPQASPSRWTFRPLRAAFAEHLGYRSTRDAAQKLGADHARALAAFVLQHAEHVVRFAQPRYEAIGRDAQALVDASLEAPGEVLVLPREGRAPFIVRSGNRVLFLADKVRSVDGRPAIVEPLTNVWDDVPFQGIAREGSVVFARNKKPERLIARVLSMATEPGDWVLDPFLGSGTTAAVAHKMGRRWVGIEAGDHARTLCEPRLRRVILGDDASGISQSVGFEGGGGFGVARVR